jgi:hypothetical protein
VQYCHATQKVFVQKCETVAKVCQKSTNSIDFGVCDDEKCSTVTLRQKYLLKNVKLSQKYVKNHQIPLTLAYAMLKIAILSRYEKCIFSKVCNCRKSTPKIIKCHCLWRRRCSKVQYCRATRQVFAEKCVIVAKVRRKSSNALDFGV